MGSVWVDGEKYDAAKTRTKLPPGTEVKFFDKTYQGAEYKELSEDSVIHQAVAVWTGERPERLLKKVQEEEYKKKLEEHRKSFMLYLRGKYFSVQPLSGSSARLPDISATTWASLNTRTRTTRKLTS